MKRSVIHFCIIALVGGFASACVEIFPLSPPETVSQSSQTPQICKAPPIADNIIGTWEFESTVGANTTVGRNTSANGIVTFTKDKKIIDPDSLFQNTILGDYATAKSYEPNAPTPDPDYLGDVFKVYVKTKKSAQINYFIVVSNECNRVHMRFWQSANNASGFGSP